MLLLYQSVSEAYLEYLNLMKTSGYSMFKFHNIHFVMLQNKCYRKLDSMYTTVGWFGTPGISGWLDGCGYGDRHTVDIELITVIKTITWSTIVCTHLSIF